MNLSGFAGAARDLATRAEASLASEACEAGAKDFLAILRIVTPKRSGRLAGSESITGPSGGGAVATAQVGPHGVIYADFREHGGTITVKRAKVLTDGATFFGKSVTQAGAHYMEKAEGAGRGAVESAVRQVADEFIRI